MRRSNNPEFGSPPIDTKLRLRGLKALGSAVTRSQRTAISTPDRSKAPRARFAAGEPHIALLGSTATEQVTDATVKEAPSDQTIGSTVDDVPASAPVSSNEVIFLSPTDARIAVGSTPGTYRSAML